MLSYMNIRRPIASAVMKGVRYLNLQEYQSKSVMDSFGVVVQEGLPASTLATARDVAHKIVSDSPSSSLIVKAQILSGGRGKGSFVNSKMKGGVKVLSSSDLNDGTFDDVVSNMLGDYLVTEQTGEAGLKVDTLLINKGIDIEKELYFAVLLDRVSQAIVVVASEKGGVDIESVDEQHIHKFYVDIVDGLREDTVQEVR